MHLVDGASAKWYPQGAMKRAWEISFSTSRATKSLPKSPALALSSSCLGRCPSCASRVGEVVTEPLPPQTRACASNALGSSHGRFAH